MRQLRKASKLTQKDLAKRIGISQSHIADIEQKTDFVVTVSTNVAQGFIQLFQINVEGLVPYPEDIDRVKGLQLFLQKENIGEENKKITN